MPAMRYLEAYFLVLPRTKKQPPRTTKTNKRNRRHKVSRLSHTIYTAIGTPENLTFLPGFEI